MDTKLKNFVVYLWDHKETLWLAAFTIYEGLKQAGIV